MIRIEIFAFMSFRDHRAPKWEGVSHLVVEAAGVELFPHSETAQIIDFAKRQKRQNRYFGQFEVHGGYTEPQSILISSLVTREVSL